MVKANPTPFNLIPDEWNFDPIKGPFIRELVNVVWQLRTRTGGDEGIDTDTMPIVVMEIDSPDETEPVPGVIAEEALMLAQQALSLLPIGMVAIWSGSTATIPGGWQICDGTNGTPDLRDNFVVGAGSTYAVDATGGATTDTTTGPSATTVVDNDGGGSTVAVGSDTHTHVADILPPYYALAYIQRIS